MIYPVLQMASIMALRINHVMNNYVTNSISPDTYEKWLNVRGCDTEWQILNCAIFIALYHDLSFIMSEVPCENF